MEWNVTRCSLGCNESKCIEKETGALSIKTKPEGVLVYLDNVNKGDTPINISGLLPGKKMLRLLKTNYTTYYTDVMIVAGNTTTIKWTMQPK